MLFILTLESIRQKVYHKVIKGGKNKKIMPKNGKDFDWKIKKIVEYIRTMNFPNAKTIAERLRNEEGISISEVTVYRDIQTLRRDYDAPIEVDMKRYGSGYYLTDRNFWSNKINLTTGELLGLGIIQNLIDTYRNTTLGRELKSIIAKMKDFIPDGKKYNPEKISEYIKVITDPMAKIDSSVFPSIINCLQERRAITFLYHKISSDRKDDQVQKYRINPYKILFTQTGDWYLMGAKTDRPSEIRTFSFARMSNIEETKERYMIPSDFRLTKYMDPQMGVWSGSGMFRVVLLFDKSIGQFVLERTWHHTQHLEQLEDGSVKLTFTTSQLHDPKRIVMTYGSLVKVLEPPELIEDVRDELKKALAMYKGR